MVMQKLDMEIVSLVLIQMEVNHMNKTSTIINRIQAVDNFQNMACFCSNWKEFTQELEEWGVTSCAKIDFDDKELDLNLLNNFILKEGN
jgi:hypothetical protein